MLTSKEAPAAIVLGDESDDVEGGLGNEQLAARLVGVAEAFKAKRERTATTEINIVLCSDL